MRALKIFLKMNSIIVLALFLVTIASGCGSEDNNNEEKTEGASSEDSGAEGPAETPNSGNIINDPGSGNGSQGGGQNGGAVEPPDQMAFLLDFTNEDILSNSGRAKAITLVENQRAKTVGRTATRNPIAELGNIVSGVASITLSNGDIKKYQLDAEELQTGIILKTDEFSVNAKPVSITIALYDANGFEFKSEVTNFEFSNNQNALRAVIQISPEGQITITPEVKYGFDITLQLSSTISLQPNDEITTLIDLTNGGLVMVELNEVKSGTFRGSVLFDPEDWGKSGFLNLTITRSGQVQYEGVGKINLDNFTPQVSLSLKNHGIYSLFTRFTSTDTGLLGFFIDLEKVTTILKEDFGLNFTDLQAVFTLGNSSNLVSLSGTTAQTEFNAVAFDQTSPFSLKILHNTQEIVLSTPTVIEVKAGERNLDLELYINQNVKVEADEMGGVSYMVTDADTGAPIPNVLAVVQNTAFSRLGDEYGVIDLFHELSLEAGEYQILFYKAGYRPISRKQIIKSGEYPVVRIALSKF